jgi:hypothetical protein
MRRNGLLSSVVLAACLTPSSLYAQQQTQQPQPPRPGVVVVSYNKCRLDAVARLDSAGLRAFYPVLDEVVRRCLPQRVRGGGPADQPARADLFFGRVVAVY